MKSQRTYLWNYLWTLALGLSFSPTVEARSVAYYNNQVPTELVSFNSCSALQEHVQKTQIVIRQDLKRERRHWEGFALGGGKGFRGSIAKKSKAARQAPAMTMSDEVSSMAMAEMESDKSSNKPGDITGTNNQVENVDEADFVKFNGKHIFQLHQGTLKILKAWPATKMNLLSSTPVKGTPKEMLIHKNSLVTLSSSGQQLAVAIYDISNPKNPRELTRFEVPGQYMTARLVGATLRIVNRDHGRAHWKHVRHQQTSNDWFQPKSTLGELKITPTTQVTQAVAHKLDVIKNCKNIYVPKKVAPSTLTRLISIDLDAKKYEESLAFINPQTIYASEKAIYLAQQTWGYESNRNVQQTAIHKFGFKRGQTIKYKASGKVNGKLINQFAMDEHKNYLRVATNGSEPTKKFWGRTGSWATVNRVQVLKETGKKLKTIGKTKNLAKGERLYSVRFNGDKGYLVTFRQVDPLFTLDLSNPRNPRAVGELKIPGFSTYIHILDKNHLLTIGKDADPRTGRAKGLKLSIFDTSDFKNPKEVKSIIFKANTQSEASYEHKAFSFYRKMGALAIPVSDGQRSALLVFKVTPKNIEFKGELAMTDMFASTNARSTVRRSFFADDVVYAVGDIGVKAAKIFNPSLPIGSVSYVEKKMSNLGW